MAIKYWGIDVSEDECQRILGGLQVPAFQGADGGQVVKAAAPGGLVTKMAYDGAGRPTVAYTTDGGGDAAPGASGNWADALTVTRGQDE